MEEELTAMTEETPVETSEPAEATVFSFAPFEESQVGAGEEAEPDGDGDQEPEQVEPIREMNNQKDVGNAFRKERIRRDKEIEKAKREYEAKLESDPVRQIGQLMVNNIMQREGKSAEEAAKIAEERFIAAYAKQEGLTPAQAKLDLRSQRILEAQAQREREPEPEPEDRIAGIVSELVNMKLPDGMDLNTAMEDDAFKDLLLDPELTPAAAVRIYKAEQDAKKAPQELADRLRARQSIPQSTRPQKAVAPQPDYRHMSSEDFFAEKERLLRRLNE